MEPIEVVVRLEPIGAFERDHRAKLVGVVQRQVQHHAPAHRASHDGGPLEAEGSTERAHGFDVELRRQPVLAVAPAHRRVGLAVPGQVEGDDAIVVGDGAVAHQVAILPRVGARGVKADQRKAAARFFHIDAAGVARDVHREVATDDRLELRHRAALPARP